ncbi:hypothetical protein [Rhizobium sp. RU36D]|uniref:hypothetical protein n=1 Tax=Rhizobium sp. RU36D TaxID=1907415 RepID=UPI0009D7BBAA|nr:hypothetical protein [Rhizobium sp. RU36D]SMC52465.1 Putative heme degradation protein [Rhizobium sp. RU36D]
MSEDTPITRQFLQADARDIIRRLPAMGKLMIIGKGNGATHERIGKVETVSAEGDLMICSGQNHDSRIDPSLIVDIVLDRSSIMQTQVYPRLDFRRADGSTLFAVVGFEGLPPFADALQDVPRLDDPNPRDNSRPQRPEVDPADPGFAPLQAALAAGGPITIAYDEPGFSQRWTGVVPKVSPGMGFINIMTDDFHLHLLGGTVSAWGTTEAAQGLELMALGQDGTPVGLTLHGEAATLTTAAAAE